MASSSSIGDISEEASIISYYFSRGYTYEVINEFLAKFHGIMMCVRTLKNRLKQLNLRRKLPSFDMDVVREQIVNELSGPGCQGGYRSMWHTLRLKGIQVPRHVVAELMREMDPAGCEQRRAKSLKKKKLLLIWSKLHMARRRIRQIKTLWVSNTWVYRWLESKNNVAYSHKVKQPSRNYCQFLFELCCRARRLSCETAD